MILTAMSLAIKIGTTAQTPTQIFENLQTALPHIIEKIPRKWKNIQSLHVKTSDSISLPIYNSLPDEPTVIKTSCVSTMIQDQRVPTVVVMQMHSLHEVDGRISISVGVSDHGIAREALFILFFCETLF
ncbi:hypothetical protein BC937DRAFT_88462 [Endogone sp. FLAS-F59071]|nr:hypothetical protein BC937DRAFT_88462 [Endogone sp. FLAS-F59071]|eukprot:RUS18675.1 hypothetical protein BC937DRAFT_88462 [Endogone sp. FLAS-F59071]